MTYREVPFLGVAQAGCHARLSLCDPVYASGPAAVVED